MLTVKSIVETTFEKWSDAIKNNVKGYSMENSGTVSKFPYASLYFMGLIGNTYTLEGDEGTVTPTIQVDIYTTGQKSVGKAYEIDELSHSSLIKMGYRRTYGPELTQSTDPSIKRLISRYSRVIGFGDLI